MKHALSVLCLIALAGCSDTKPSPIIADTYFAAKYSYTVVLAGAVGYKEVCAKQKKANNCHAVVAKLRQLDDAVKAAEKRVDIAMLSGDLFVEQDALASYKSSIDALKAYKEENI